MWGGGGVGEKERRGLAEGSRRREPARVGCGRKRQEGGTVVHGLASRGGTEGRTDGGREELGGLVGWRRWGSPTATQTHRSRQKEERTGTGRISVFQVFAGLRLNLKLVFILTRCHFRAPMCKCMHVRRYRVPALTQTTTYIMR